MLSHDIERLLRMPALDEPAVLPALALPSRSGGGFGVVRGNVRGGSFGGSVGFGSPRLVLAVLALLAAMVGAIATGALRLDRLPNPFDPNAGYGGRGITVDYPKEWTRLTPNDPFNQSGAFTALIVSSTGAEGCSASDLGPNTDPTPIMSGNTVEFPPDYQGYDGRLEDRIFECVIGKPMAPGEIRIVVSQGYPQRIGVGPIEANNPTDWFGADAALGVSTFYIPTEKDGWTQVIDGMPAKFVIEPDSIVPGAEEVRTWGVYDAMSPFGLGLWFVRATLRGPDLDALRLQADAVARSLRFDSKPPALDEATRDIALARAIDKQDRDSREFYGSKMWACFPRAAGEQTVVLEDGPAGPLLQPVTVTCRTTIEWTPLRVWHATFLMSWEAAGDGFAAGQCAWELLFGSDSSSGGGGFDCGRDTSFPGTDGPLPPPLEGPLIIPLGSLVEVLPPGVNQSEGGPIQAFYQDPNPTIGNHLVHDALPGQRFYVVDGPLAHAGTDWYLVQVQHGSYYGSEFSWLPATSSSRPLLRVAEPKYLTS